MNNKITRREALVFGALPVAAIFGGQLVSAESHGYHVAVRAGTPWNDQLAWSLCGGCHIGKGWIVSAAHCGAPAEAVEAWRIGGLSVQPRAFIPQTYTRASLDYDVMLLRVPQLAHLPALPLGTKADHEALRAEIASNGRADVLVLGDGTTALDGHARPTDAAKGLRVLDAYAIDGNGTTYGVTSRDGAGGVCVGDSGCVLIWRGLAMGCTSSVPADQRTLLPCQGDGWRATYTAFEPHLAAMSEIVGAV